MVNGRVSFTDVILKETVIVEETIKWTSLRVPVHTIKRLPNVDANGAVPFP
jgi:hypothetical protein